MKWYRTEDRYPEVNECVLAADEEGNVFPAVLIAEPWMTAGSGWFSYAGEEIPVGCAPTHWMHFPNPPKQDRPGKDGTQWQ